MNLVVSIRGLPRGSRVFSMFELRGTWFYLLIFVGACEGGRGCVRGDIC